jgi:hypothetical protein
MLTRQPISHRDDFRRYDFRRRIPQDLALECPTSDSRTFNRTLLTCLH